MILKTQLHADAVIACVQVKEGNLIVADAFKAELLALVDGGAKYLAVDLEKVVYVDSSFLGALVSALKHAITNKAEIVVCGLNKDVLGLFQLIRLDKAFRIYGTAEGALQNRAT